MGGLDRAKTGWGLITARWGWVAAAAGVVGLLLIAAALVVQGSLRIGLFYTSVIFFGLAGLLIFRALARSRLRRSISARLRPISGPFNSLNVSFLGAVLLVLPALSPERDLFTIMVVMFSGGLLFLYALVLMTTESGRKRVFTRLSRLGPPGVVVYLVVVSFYAILFFAGLTVLIYRYHALSFSATPDALGMRHVTAFYAWHFADSLPLVDFNKTVKWGEPLPYSDARLGLLVVTFKFVAIAPVFATLRAFWLYQKEKQQPQQESESDTPV